MKKTGWGGSVVHDKPHKGKCKHDWLPYIYKEARVRVEAPYGNRTYFGDEEPESRLLKVICIKCKKIKKVKG